MNELMVSFQCWAGSVDDDINYFWWAAKTVAGSYMRVTMGDLLVWALKLDPSLHQDTIGKLSSMAFDWWYGASLGGPLCDTSKMCVRRVRLTSHESGTAQKSPTT
jgi:hypothetical protein